MGLPNPFKMAANAVLAIPRGIAARKEEQRRIREQEAQRVATPPCYEDGVNEHQFRVIVESAKTKLPRIKSVTIEGFVVSLEVKSMSGISIWCATVDFNDFGHLTGWYKIWSENEDSNIPEAFAREVNELIEECKAASA